MEIYFFHPDIKKLIKSLETETSAKVIRTFDLLYQFGSDLGMPHSKSIGNNLFELRVKGKQEIRFLYCYKSNKVVVLFGFVKKSNRISKRYIKTAIKRMNSIDQI